LLASRYDGALMDSTSQRLTWSDDLLATDLKVRVRVPSGVQGQRAVDVRKRTLTALHDSSTVDPSGQVVVEVGLSPRSIPSGTTHRRRRLRDGRLRTKIGNVATLDDAVAALNPTGWISGQTIIRVRP
jgi:hypothetical protein